MKLFGNGEVALRTVSALGPNPEFERLSGWAGPAGASYALRQSHPCTAITGKSPNVTAAAPMSHARRRDERELR